MDPIIVWIGRKRDDSNKPKKRTIFFFFLPRIWLWRRQYICVSCLSSRQAKYTIDYQKRKRQEETKKKERQLLPTDLFLLFLALPTEAKKTKKHERLHSIKANWMPSEPENYDGCNRRPTDKLANSIKKKKKRKILESFCCQKKERIDSDI